MGSCLWCRVSKVITSPREMLVFYVAPSFPVLSFLCVGVFFILAVSFAMSVLTPCSCSMGARSPPRWCQGCVAWGFCLFTFLFKFSSVLLLSKFFVSVSSIGGFLQADRGMDMWGPPGVRVKSWPRGLHVSCAGLWGQCASLLISPYSCF